MYLKDLIHYYSCDKKTILLKNTFSKFKMLKSFTNIKIPTKKFRAKVEMYQIFFFKVVVT